MLTTDYEYFYSLKDAAKNLHGASSAMQDGDYKPIIITPTVQDELVASNEATPLLATVTDNNHFKESVSEEEHITFADIPMPGLWAKDEAGKNSDRIIILLFILLASMVVVSTSNNCIVTSCS